MMECRLVRERCIACGLCQVAAPDFFEYDDDGIVLFQSGYSPDESQSVPNQSVDAVIEAAKECPTHAILLDQ